MVKPPIVYLNGQWLAADCASVSVFDRGFLFGDGVYEVIAVYQKHSFRLEQHLIRLFNSLSQVGIPNPLGMHEWRYIVEQLIERNEGQQQSIYIQVTRGVSDKRSHNYPTDLTPTVFASSQPLHLKQSNTLTNPVCSATLLEDIRWARGDIKSTSLLGSVLLKKAVYESGKDEGILCREGVVMEGTASNVFIVCDGAIRTPRLSPLILTGITRDFIFELCGRYHLSISESDITVQELLSADEVWLSSSTAEIRSVVEIDGQVIGSGDRGTLWLEMAGYYQKHKSELFCKGS